MGLLIRTEMMVMGVITHVGKVMVMGVMGHVGKIMITMVEEEEVGSVKEVDMVLLILTRLTPRQAVMTAILAVVGIGGVEGEAEIEVAVVSAGIPLLVLAWTRL